MAQQFKNKTKHKTTPCVTLSFYSLFNYYMHVKLEYKNRKQSHYKERHFSEN